MLLRLHQLSWAGGDVDDLQYADADLHGQLEALQVQSLSRLPSTDMHPPGFYLTPESWGGGVPGWDGVLHLVISTLNGPTMDALRRQLAAAEADQRHAFLFLGWRYVEAIPLSSPGTDLPDVAPDLPEPVDAIWLTSHGAQRRLIAWLPGRGWINGRLPTS